MFEVKKHMVAGSWPFREEWENDEEKKHISYYISSSQRQARERRDNDTWNIRKRARFFPHRRLRRKISSRERANECERKMKILRVEVCSGWRRERKIYRASRVHFFTLVDESVATQQKRPEQIEKSSVGKTSFAAATIEVFNIWNFPASHTLDETCNKCERIDTHKSAAAFTRESRADVEINKNSVLNARFDCARRRDTKNSSLTRPTLDRMRGEISAQFQ